ncbi:MAG TPA: hypothetical protein VMY41_04370 [Thermohalobaculum sp.]|nr:hypothetical protein [Thermohalobaculum sp.]
MKRSIYQSTKDKLLTHGVCKTADGRLTLSDRTLFLKFVRLERAVKLEDFESVQTAVQNIKNYAESIEKRHLVLFVYMYLRFSDGSPKVTHADEPLEGGGLRRVLDYRREVTPNARLIADWAGVWYKRNSPAFFRALYADK